MSLNAENLTVESFVTTSAIAQQDQQIGGTGTEYPNCIVYVSDCVSCPIEP
ncbi:hypothetical protein [Longimicrobium sp.]|uniref:hypothetical protein n=1 Tax=Longimicrobium sp. TaxID=2029185 RepID=UPI002E34C6B6|nr:hypothetical protein [Longimicrobium sp.]HEX6036983.1 hypothetical protein [Longimicrobium sp.]